MEDAEDISNDDSNEGEAVPSPAPALMPKQQVLTRRTLAHCEGPR
jgi:hypothetical protein